MISEVNSEAPVYTIPEGAPKPNTGNRLPDITVTAVTVANPQTIVESIRAINPSTKFKFYKAPLNNL